MADSPRPQFAPRRSSAEVEEGFELAPKFDADGLVPCIVADEKSGELLMLGYMNADSLALTIDTGEAHFWSRSRQAIWKKGETSGRTLTVKDLRIDCDQDAVLLLVQVAEDGAVCHLGYRTCFFRSVPLRTGAKPPELRLEKREDAPVFDPKSVYGKDGGGH